jgi:hypothetical protein
MESIIAYYYPFWHPGHLEHDLREIQQSGATAVLFAIHEEDVHRWPRDLARGLNLPRTLGLRVYASLARYGGIFNGPHLVPSWYTFRHPETRVVDRHGLHHDLACVNQEPFRRWLFRETQRLIQTYPLDGILLDEPQGSDITCFCPACHALCPDVMDLARFHRQSFIAFLQDFSQHIKSLGATTMLLLHPRDTAQIDDFAVIDGLDALGITPRWWDSPYRSSAPCSSPAPLLPASRPTLREQSERLIRAAHLQRKQAHLWVRNFCLDAEHETHLAAIFATVADCRPDAIGSFYYWRDNVNPRNVWEQTRLALRRLPRRQLRWQAILV